MGLKSMEEDLKVFTFNDVTYSKFGDTWFDPNLGMYSSITEIMLKNSIKKEDPCCSE
jgi:hypothetical protein